MILSLLCQENMFVFFMGSLKADDNVSDVIYIKMAS